MMIQKMKNLLSFHEAGTVEHAVQGGLKNWLWEVELEDENFERVYAVDQDSLPIYDVYFDDSDLEVSTSIHIEETIQESDNKCSMQVKSSCGRERCVNTFFLDRFANTF